MTLSATNEDYHKMARLDTNTKLRIVKREIFSRLQRDESLIQMILIDLLKEGSRGSATVESFRRHKKGALGSELLAELKQAVDLESIVVQRCWELMGDEWFEECVKNVDLSH